MFDCNEVVKKFMKREYPERKELMHEFRDFVIHSPEAKKMLVEICQEILDRKGMPTELAGFSLIYGMVVGVLLEREKNSRALDKD